MKTKRLKRSKTDKMIGGVCGGIAKYFDTDPVFIRLICVALLLINGFTLVAYIIAWIVMPLEKLEKPVEPEIKTEE